MKLFYVFSAVILGLLGSLVMPAHAGFRCSLGELACSAGCVALGHSSGKHSLIHITVVKKSFQIIQKVM